MANTGPFLMDALFLAACVTCVKLLLVPAYRSTDFEVHRNWLAVTSSLPLSQWYVDETSPWTLDYPPLFAWFERALALVALRVDPLMTDLRRGLDYASPATVLFQRLSVMASDLMLVYATYRYCRTLAADALPGEADRSTSARLKQGGEGEDAEPSAPGGRQRRKAGLVLGAVLLLPGLLIVDHIHFQYNGLLLGLLVLCAALLREGHDWAAGAVFACLCCMKHLFAVAGPWFLVFLLRGHCLAPPASITRVLFRASRLGLTVASILLITFGPFLALGQMGQLLSRLFPFGRGLCHAYWAPNAWALYNALDKALLWLASRLPLPLPAHLAQAVAQARSHAPSFTRGLVGHGSGAHAILAQITPGVSLALVLGSMVPCLVHIWLRPAWHRRHVARSLAYVFLCAFLFGWHVHEKASLHFVLLLALAAADSPEENASFLYISTVTQYSLFPLLFGHAEYPIKTILLLLYGGGLLAISGACTTVPHATAKGDDESTWTAAWRRILNLIRALHVFGLVLLETYIQVLHPMLFGRRLEFLPLMLISVYSSLGVVGFYIQESVLLFSS